MNELEKAYIELLEAVVDYREYTHDGDPFTEDLRVMNEMSLDFLDIEKYLKIAYKIAI